MKLGGFTPAVQGSISKLTFKLLIPKMVFVRVSFVRKQIPKMSKIVVLTKNINTRTANCIT